MKPGEWTLRSRRVVTPTGTRAADILISGETIAGVAAYRDPAREGVILDVGDRLVLPGLIDIQGNGSDPAGKATGWCENVTSCAAAGGVTTVVDLPIQNRPSTSSASSFESKVAAATGRLWVDCGFLGCLVPGSAVHVARLIESGVLGIVAILEKTSSNEAAATRSDLREAMPTLERQGRPLLVLSGRLATDSADPEAASLPSLIALCREHPCRVHLLRVSTDNGLAGIAEARAEGLSMTVETCTEYLISPDDEASAGDSRPRSDRSTRRMIHRERLWEGLRRGMIDSIGSGCRPGDGPGSASLRLALPFVWSEAKRRGFTPDDLARWMSQRPAEILGLAGRKGSIVEGADADFVIFDADASLVVDSTLIQQAQISPAWKGRTLAGQLVATILRGQLIHESGRLHGEPQGIPVLRLDDTEKLPNGLERLNKLSQGEALELLRACCGSSRWTWRLLALRPFVSIVDLLDSADRVWATLDRADRQEAFAAHRRISDREAPRPNSSLKVFPKDESSKPPGSPSAILHELARADREYEAKFEFHFILASDDLPPTDLLALLRQRTLNDPEAEYRIASWEQAEITRQRLRNLISGA
jgi:allantoinase